MSVSKLETITSPSNHVAAVGRFTFGQLATRKTWAGIPDYELIMASLHRVDVKPIGSTTICELNPLDPGTVYSEGGVTSPGWLNRPGHNGRNVPAGRK